MKIDSLTFGMRVKNDAYKRWGLFHYNWIPNYVNDLISNKVPNFQMNSKVNPPGHDALLHLHSHTTSFLNPSSRYCSSSPEHFFFIQLLRRW